MARLRHGFTVLHDEADAQAEAQADAASVGSSARHPNRAAPGRARAGDNAALQEFADSNNLQAS